MDDNKDNSVICTDHKDSDTAIHVHGQAQAQEQVQDTTLPQLLTQDTPIVIDTGIGIQENTLLIEVPIINNEEHKQKQETHQEILYTKIESQLEQTDIIQDTINTNGTDTQVQIVTPINVNVNTNIHNGKQNQDEDEDYIFITRISTEDLMKAYDAKAEQAFRKTISAPQPTAPAEDPTIQLLAILEGDEALTAKVTMDKPRRSKLTTLDPASEKAIALQQLKEMPPARRKKRDRLPQIVDVKIPKVAAMRATKETTSPISSAPVVDSSSKNTATPKTVTDSGDLSFIIDDWNDEEVEDVAEKTSIENVANTDSVAENPPPANGENATSTEENDCTPISRRAQRVIKKKVIFDPDNPDTFKYASAIIKKTSEREGRTVREDSDEEVPEHVPETGKNKKSPVVSSTPSKKKKKTEVDRLLMDEGAVNMIYQVERDNNNSEVPDFSLKPNKNSMISISKEKKTLISKAIVIKNAVLNKSSNSSDKTKTFRSRKDSKATDTTTHRVEKIRPSDMRSPSLSEIVGDESRIIRRHSSSSFSSGCLSPRPQSPPPDASMISLDNGETAVSFSDDSFRFDSESAVQSSTPDTFVKPGKISGKVSVYPKKKGRPRKNLLPNLGNNVEAAKLGVLRNYSQLVLNITEKVAHVTIKPSANTRELFDAEVMSELADAIKVGGRANAILLTSTDGAFCTGLDLRKVLNSVADKRKDVISKIISAYRNLVMSMYNSTAALVIGIGGSCSGLGVALLTFSDLVMASDSATFCAAPRYRRQLPPEGSVLLTSSNILPKQLSRELLLCGRKLTASEALQRGLVARTLWPDRFQDELYSIVEDIANQSSHSFEVMKHVLRYKDSTAVSSALKYECQLLSEFWCSPEGQQAIQETHCDI